MKIYLNPPSFERKRLCQRPQIEQKNLNKTVADVFNMVQENGNLALKGLTKRFDKVSLNKLSLNKAEISV